MSLIDALGPSKDNFTGHHFSYYREKNMKAEELYTDNIGNYENLKILQGAFDECARQLGLYRLELDERSARCARLQDELDTLKEAKQ